MNIFVLDKNRKKGEAIASNIAELAKQLKLVYKIECVVEANKILEMGVALTPLVWINGDYALMGHACMNEDKIISALEKHR